MRRRLGSARPRAISPDFAEEKKLSMTFVDRAICRIFLAIFLSWMFAAPQAHAQVHYPDKPVRIVVPFAPGGVGDITARIVAEKLGDRLGQRFFIENMPGAGGIAAARAVIAAPHHVSNLLL